MRGVGHESQRVREKEEGRLWQTKELCLKAAGAGQVRVLRNSKKEKERVAYWREMKPP